MAYYREGYGFRFQTRPCLVVQLKEAGKLKLLLVVAALDERLYGRASGGPKKF